MENRLDPEHTAWTVLLRKYVDDGVVDYAGLKARGEPELNAYLGSLEAVGPEAYARFQPPEWLAFWVNVYNAYTVRLILDHYPLTSIRRIGWLPLAAFRERFIPLRVLGGGRKLSLGQVEHEQLRARGRDPRIHFAIVCASKSCPKLRGEAYRASEVHAQLDDAARAFVRDPLRNRVDSGKGTAEVSRIFQWFRSDFERDGQTLGEYIARYAEPAAAEVLRKKGRRPGFLGYDWSLNDR
ncbi:MAG TPA: DUF547 domain-containing protein [Archangium sp.]|nr:DUF547 domain-containing protein [Archangium sp.]